MSALRLSVAKSKLKQSQEPVRTKENTKRSLVELKVKTKQLLCSAGKYERRNGDWSVRI